MGEVRSGGRPGLPLAEARQISERLREFVRRVARLDSHAQLAQRTRIGRPTITSWFRRKPVLPTAPHLIRLARETNLSLDWLLLGEGVPLRGAGGAPSVGVNALLDYFEAELKALNFPPFLSRSFLRYWRTEPRVVLARMQAWLLDEIVASLEAASRQHSSSTSAEMLNNVLLRAALMNEELAEDVLLVRKTLIAEEENRRTFARLLEEAKAKRDAFLASSRLFAGRETAQQIGQPSIEP